MQVEIIPVFVEFIPEKELMEERKLYISKEYHCAIHLCLCGCKEETVTPLMGNMWIIIENEHKVGLSPSIGNFQMPCQSHYVITNNVAVFC